MGKKIVRVILAIFLGGILILSIMLLCQYRPADLEQISVNQQGTKTVNTGDTVKVMSWNIGYGALGQTADFFMDGGKMVNTATKNQVFENVQAVSDQIKKENPDVVILQEVDVASKRSHHIDEYSYILDRNDDYLGTFAYNFKVLYVPYPIPNIGKVNGGLATLQKYSLTESTRVQLYCPFNFFVKAFNLRRCLMVNRIPVENSDKELVIVNLHLEAYDSGEGKVRQAQQLFDYIENEYKKGNYVITGGDFNQVFSDVDMSSYKNLVDTWQPAVLDVDDFQNFTAVTDGLIPTCRSLDKPYVNADKDDFQFYVIDGFLVSNNLEIIDIATLDLEFKNSDHNPLVLNVRLK